MTVVMVMVIDVMMVMVMVMAKLIVTMVSAHRGESSQTNQILFFEVFLFYFRGGACRTRP